MKLSGLFSHGLLAAFLWIAAPASAQTLFGVNPFNNDASALPGSAGLFVLDNNTGAIITGRVITVPARTIDGAVGLARDPTTGLIYAVVRANAVVGRLLVRINLTTGAAIEVGNLGDNFSSIAFRNDGQLFGVTGDGATVPETLFTINKATAVATFAATLGNGADGEVIAYRPNDNSFYHWSGGAIAFERIQATPPFTVTPIAITGAPGGEVFGAVWDPARNQFLVHNISSVMDFWTATGVRSNTQPATLEDVRGMVLLPAFTGDVVVPTLGQWSLLLLSLLMGATAIIAIRRRGLGAPKP